MDPSTLEVKAPRECKRARIVKRLLVEVKVNDLQWRLEGQHFIVIVDWFVC